jgi:hypothetical protein
VEGHQRQRPAGRQGAAGALDDPIGHAQVGGDEIGAPALPHQRSVVLRRFGVQDEEVGVVQASGPGPAGRLRDGVGVTVDADDARAVRGQGQREPAAPGADVEDRCVLQALGAEQRPEARTHAGRWLSR